MGFINGDSVDVAGLAYARGQAPGGCGRIRVAPADFIVEEDCKIVPGGEGEHFWLWVEKTGLTTPQAVERLSAATGVHPKYIGYSGLKDRHAVTRQWFSLAWPIKSAPPVWPDACDCCVLAAHRHHRKLKRGAHRGNRFEIRVRELDPADADRLDDTVARIRCRGVPNYFGAQRFGRDGANIALARAVFAGKRVSRNQRGFALSAARSLLFNAVLDARVRAGAWDRPLAGDVLMLAGSHSLFAAAENNESLDSLAARASRGDIHPTGPMPGRISPAAVVPDDEAGALENRVLGAFTTLIDGLSAAGVDADRRALRASVGELGVERVERDLIVRFYLGAGAFATSVLRELVRTREARDHAGG